MNVYMFQVEFLPSRTCTDIHNNDLRLHTKCTACVTLFGKQINVHFHEIRVIKKIFRSNKVSSENFKLDPEVVRTDDHPDIYLFFAYQQDFNGEFTIIRIKLFK